MLLNLRTFANPNLLQNAALSGEYRLCTIWLVPDGVDGKPSASSSPNFPFTCEFPVASENFRRTQETAHSFQM